MESKRALTVRNVMMEILQQVMDVPQTALWKLNGVAMEYSENSALAILCAETG